MKLCFTNLHCSIGNNVSFQEIMVTDDFNQVDPETTFCEFSDIVLPQHANHHRTTFGGQVRYNFIQSLIFSGFFSIHEIYGTFSLIEVCQMFLLGYIFLYWKIFLMLSNTSRLFVRLLYPCL